ncbi:hypothetical protein IMZ48_10645 [Candidatus Bathyarchaeota archaeon]|nr:hypothetical protein [Candidatus Bathyarchaeota archaeon]
MKLFRIVDDLVDSAPLWELCFGFGLGFPGALELVAHRGLPKVRTFTRAPHLYLNHRKAQKLQYQYQKTIQQRAIIQPKIGTGTELNH